MWLMVVLIWIQTGFAMVILSSAIKAVPTELHRGGQDRRRHRVAGVLADHAAPDRADDRRRRHDALIVTVMKVFDIV